MRRRAFGEEPTAATSAVLANLSEAWNRVTTAASTGAQWMGYTPYPWLAYSSQTEKLQQDINQMGQQGVDAGLYSSYCRIGIDGKLGPNTCYAARAVGLDPPSSCQSFATSCGGTLVRKNAPPLPAPTPTPLPTAPPSPPPPRRWIDDLRQMPAQSWLAALAVGALIGVGSAYAMQEMKR